MVFVNHAERKLKMLDVLLDALMDTLKLIPYLFVTFLLLELVEHKLNKKTELKITNLPTQDSKPFSIIKKRYERQRVVILGNHEVFSNPYMMKDTFTGDLIIPDEADGCYRKLDIQTGELTGERFAPCMPKSYLHRLRSFKTIKRSILL